MFIIWGTKTSSRKLGRVAAYCAMCDEATTQKVSAVGTVGHLYYIPLGRITVRAWSARCECCKHEQARSEGTSPRPVKNRRATLEELVDLTNPGLPEQIADRLDRYDRLLEGALDPDERLTMMLEPVMAVAGPVEERAAQTQLDRWALLGVLSMVLLTILGCMVAAAVVAKADMALVVGGLSGFGVGLVATLVLIATDTRRFIRRRYAAFLGRRLARFNPDRAGLDALVEAVRRRSPKLGKRLSADKLQRWIEDARLRA